MYVKLLRCRGNIKEASNKSLFILYTANPKSLSLPRGAASLALPEMEARENDGENASFPQMHGGKKVGKTNLGNFGIGAHPPPLFPPLPAAYIPNWASLRPQYAARSPKGGGGKGSERASEYWVFPFRPPPPPPLSSSMRCSVENERRMVDHFRSI